MWIIFEGLDKAGKTTLEWEFLKATNFKHIVIDRGPIGYMIFDEIFERSTKFSKQNFIHYARKLIKTGDFLIIYCKAPYDVISKRLKDHNEKCPYDYKLAQKKYDIGINRYYQNKYVLELNTDQSIENCINKIIEKLKEVCYEHY